VSKTYEVSSQKNITNNYIKPFKMGNDVNECLGKAATLVKNDEAYKSFVTIYEERYHEVKRMFHALHKEVLALLHIRLGELKRDESLATGDYRHLTQIEFKQLEKK